MSERLGVGLIGAGIATQAIHLPTLARLSDLFRVVSVTDPDQELAHAVAARAGARATSYEELLVDPRVDVVAACSPNRFHAGQVSDVCRAGIKGILCEKPLATTHQDAVTLGELVKSTGTALVVGAQHQFDPAIREALHSCEGLRAEAHTITSSIVLPYDDRYTGWATQPVRHQGGASPLEGVEFEANMIFERVMSLAIHDLPIIRLFAPGAPAVKHAEVLAPIGTAIQLGVAGRDIELASFIRPIWRPEWRLDVWSDQEALGIEFTPSYVHSGSAKASLRRGLHELVFGPTAPDGYDAEWRELHAQVVEDKEPSYSTDSLVADLQYALCIAEQAATVVRRIR